MTILFSFLSTIQSCWRASRLNNESFVRERHVRLEKKANKKHQWRQSVIKLEQEFSKVIYRGCSSAREMTKKQIHFCFSSVFDIFREIRKIPAAFPRRNETTRRCGGVCPFFSKNYSRVRVSPPIRPLIFKNFHRIEPASRSSSPFSALSSPGRK